MLRDLLLLLAVVLVHTAALCALTLCTCCAVPLLYCLDAWSRAVMHSVQEITSAFASYWREGPELRAPLTAGARDNASRCRAAYDRLTLLSTYLPNLCAAVAGRQPRRAAAATTLDADEAATLQYLLEREAEARPLLAALEGDSSSDAPSWANLHTLVDGARGAAAASKLTGVELTRVADMCVAAAERWYAAMEEQVMTGASALRGNASAAWAASIPTTSAYTVFIRIVTQRVWCILQAPLPQIVPPQTAWDRMAAAELEHAPPAHRRIALPFAAACLRLFAWLRVVKAEEEDVAAFRAQVCAVQVAPISEGGTDFLRRLAQQCIDQFALVQKLRERSGSDVYDTLVTMYATITTACADLMGWYQQACTHLVSLQLLTVDEVGVPLLQEGALASGVLELPLIDRLQQRIRAMDAIIAAARQQMFVSKRYIGCTTSFWTREEYVANLKTVIAVTDELLEGSTRTEYGIYDAFEDSAGVVAGSVAQRVSRGYALAMRLAEERGMRLLSEHHTQMRERVLSCAAVSADCVRKKDGQPAFRSFTLSSLSPILASASFDTFYRTTCELAFDKGFNWAQEALEVRLEWLRHLRGASPLCSAAAAEKMIAEEYLTRRMHDACVLYMKVRTWTEIANSDVTVLPLPGNPEEPPSTPPPALSVGYQPMHHKVWDASHARHAPGTRVYLVGLVPRRRIPSTLTSAAFMDDRHVDGNAAYQEFPGAKFLCLLRPQTDVPSPRHGSSAASSSTLSTAIDRDAHAFGGEAAPPSAAAAAVIETVEV